MILVPRSVRVYFATQPTNLRRSFEGLSNEVREVLRYDPLLCGAVRNVAAMVIGRLGRRVQRGWREGPATFPLAGHVFVFLNRRRNQVKLLVYTRGGFTIVHKKLDAGKFELPRPTTPGEQHLVVSDAIFEVIHKGVAVTPRAARRRVH